MRVSAGQEIVVRLRVGNDAGDLVDADTPPTVVVVDGAGTQVAAGAAVQESTGVYTFTVGPRVQLDMLTATWAVLVGGYARTVADSVNVVGMRLVEPWLLREDPELAGVSSERLGRTLDRVEETFKSALNFPAVPEASRVAFMLGRGASYANVYDAGGPRTLTGSPLSSGGRMLVPGILSPLGLYSASFNGASMGDVSLVAVANGAFEWSDGRSWLPGRYGLWLTHGMASPPEDLRSVAAIFARYVARSSNVPERATSITTQQSTITFAMPTPDRPTGLPEVDAVLLRYRDEALL